MRSLSLVVLGLGIGLTAIASSCGLSTEGTGPVLPTDASVGGDQGSSGRDNLGGSEPVQSGGFGTGGTEPGSGGFVATGGLASGGTAGSGGAPGSGGTAGSGGAPGFGGTAGSGGAPGFGGTAGSGGVTGSGGTEASGGASGFGGTEASGGAPGSGGTEASGGAPGSGGTEASGGAPGSGGAAGEGTGGTVLYEHMVPIVIQANGAVVPVDYSINIAINHEAMIASGSQADGNDVRIRRRLQAETWCELHRVRSLGGANWGANAVPLWFALQAEMAADGVVDTEYALFYGGQLSSTALSDPAKVYVYLDDFESADLSAWTAENGVWTLETQHARSGMQALRFPDGSDSDSWMVLNNLSETDIAMDAFWYMEGVNHLDVSQGVRAVLSTHSQYETNLDGNGGWDISMMSNGGWHEVAGSQGGNPDSGVWTRITVEVIGQQVRVLRELTELIPFTAMDESLPSGSIGFRRWTVENSGALWIDDVRVRKLVNPAPSASFGQDVVVPQNDVLPCD